MSRTKSKLVLDKELTLLDEILEMSDKLREMNQELIIAFLKNIDSKIEEME